MSLLTNGGFETGDLTGWTESGGWAGGPVGVFDSFETQEGTYSCWLGTRYSSGFGLDDDSGISQVFATTSGTSYTASAWLAVPSGLPSQSSTVNITLRLIDVDSATTLATTSLKQSDLNLDSYLRYRVSADATGTTTRFQIRVTNSNFDGTWYVLADGCAAVEADVMAIRLSERAVDEVVSLLQTNLSTEITAIETERGDGLSIPVPASTEYYKYDKGEIAGATVHVEVYEESFDILNPYSDQDTQRAVTEVPVVVRVTFFRRSGETAAQMNTLRRRYATAVLNTLLVNTTYSDDAVQRILLNGVRYSEDYAEDGTMAKVQATLSGLVKMEESYA